MNETLQRSQGTADPSQGPLEPSFPGLIEAWVSAGGVDTRYWRAGTGTCVLVLLDPVTLGETVTGQALARLARMHRLVITATTDAIATATSAGPTSGVSWLRGLIEGLGVAPVAVVAATIVEATLREYLSTRSEAPACVLWLQSCAQEVPQATTLETPGLVLANLPLGVGVERLAGWLSDHADPPRR